MPAHLTAQIILIMGAQGAGAKLAGATAHDHKVGVGADHLEIVGGGGFQDRQIIGQTFRRKGEAGAENKLGIGDIFDLFEAGVLSEDEIPEHPLGGTYYFSRTRKEFVSTIKVDMGVYEAGQRPKGWKDPLKHPIKVLQGLEGSTQE